MEARQSSEVKWDVLNPEAEYELLVQTTAPRLADLHRKTIGLFWNGKPNGDILLDAIGKLLKQRFENIELIKFDLYIGVGPENIRQMAERCDGVVTGIGD